MKRFLFSCLIACLSCSTYAQHYKDMMLDLNINYYTVVDSAESYFNTINKNTKGSGYKEFKRWQYFNEKKYAPTGDRNLVSPYFLQQEHIKFKNSEHKTRALNNKWRELGPNFIDTITGHYAVGLGRIEDVYIHPSNPNIIYAGSRSGGFWKTTNGGLTWQGRTTDTLPASGVNCITASPTNADSILINVRHGNNGTSYGLYRSTNGGNTWAQSNFNPITLGAGGLGSNFQIYTVKYHPTVPNLVFIGTNKGIYRSSDNLNTWTNLYPTGQITQIIFHPTNANIMYVYDNVSGGVNENKVLVSTDLGISYTPSAVLAGNSNATLFLSTSNACVNCLYAGSNNGIWRSVDSGKTYTFLSNPAQSCRGFAVNTYDTSKMVAGYVDLERSTDGGTTFNQCTWWSLGSAQHNGTGSNQSAFNNSQVYIHADVDYLTCVNGVYYAGTDGFVVKSIDDGNTWTILSKNIAVRENYCLGTSQSNHYVTMCGSQDNGESIKVKDKWIEFYGADGMEGVVQPLNDKWLIGSVQYGNRRRTKDGGYTQDNGGPNVSDAYWVAPLAYNPTHQMQLYDFTDSVMKSDEFGNNWQYVGKPLFSGDIMCAAVAENNGNKLVVSRNASINLSTDGGITYSNIKNNLPNYTITDIAFDPKNDNTIAVTYNRYLADNQKIFITTDAGATWNNITYNLGNIPIQAVAIDHTPQKNIYVGTEIGVFTKTFNDTTWVSYNEGFGRISVNELEINYGSNTIKAATWGRGLWENSLVNRENYPAIVYTNITTPPTDQQPRVGIDQYVSSSIHYSGTLTSVYLMWGIDTINLTNKIQMNYLTDSTYKSISPLPNAPANSKIYFKVYAVGNNNDTSETYRFMYTIRPSIYCDAAGTSDAGDLFISNVTIDNVNNTTLNDSISYYNNPILNLYPNNTYTLNVTANTGWSDNDIAAWIDFNGDRLFDEASEVVLYAPNIGQSASSTFTLPSAVNGLDSFRMRVRLSYWGANPTPCGISFGEVEDYAVQLNYPTGNITLSKIGLEVFPSPASNEITLQLPRSILENNVNIYNIEGKKVLYKEIKFNNQNRATLDIKKLPAGNYFIQIGNFKTQFIKK